jgi:AhpD family alkylhydroperoxidase
MTDLDVAVVTPETYQAMCAFSETAGRDLDRRLAALVQLRVSQLNGCAYCIDMHVREADAAGIPTRQLHALAAWQRTSFFDERERRALLLAEAVTSAVGAPPASEDALRAAAEVLKPVELAQLLWTIAAVNAWNRIASATGLSPAAPR